LFAGLAPLHGVEAPQEKKIESHLSVSAEKTERQRLIQECNSIIEQTNELFLGLSERFRLDLCPSFQFDKISTIEQEITRYLNKVGTPTALGLLKEYKKHKWNPL
jgi:hypothetical protein